MPRLSTVIAIAIAATALAAQPAASASARDRQKAPGGTQYKYYSSGYSSGAQYGSKPRSRPAPARRPRAIDRDRSLSDPPPLPPSSTERNYYGPAPGIQRPMERVPLPRPLADPPIR
jgi:hypothetical protein